MMAGSAVLLMALAGCAGEDQSGAPGRDDAATSSAPAGPTTPTDAEAGDGAPDPGEAGDDAPLKHGTLLAKGQLDASALPKGYPRKASTTDDDTVVITASESGCTKVTAELVKQTESEVEVLLVHTTPADKPMCTMDIRFPKVAVELDEPLGERKLVLKAEQRKQ